MLKVWKIYNGWQGFEAVCMVVVSATSKDAVEVARKWFKKADRKNPRYWNNLTAEFECEASEGSAGKIQE